MNRQTDHKTFIPTDREESMQTDMPTKTDYRWIMSRQRNSLSKELHDSYCESIFHNLLQMQAFYEGKELLCYQAIRSEVTTAPLFTWYQNHQRPVASPRVEKDSMAFYYYHDEKELSSDNRYHIPEPTGNEKCLPDEKSVIILPGLLFDLSGNRVGYGGGYYDRYLADMPAIMKIAVAFDFQVIRRLPKKLTEPTDIPVDYIVTERQIYQCRQ